MDEYFVFCVMPIPSLRYGCIITVVSRKEKTCLVCVAHTMQCTSPCFTKSLSFAVRKGKWKRGVNGFHASICVTCWGVCARLITPPTNSYAHQLLATTKVMYLGVGGYGGAKLVQ